MNDRGGAWSRLLGPGLAIGAAVSFALSVPLGKWLLGEMGSFTLAGILYLGAGVGLALYRLAIKKPARRDRVVGHTLSSRPLRRSRLSLAGAVVCGGIIAPALLFYGLVSLQAAGASLLLSMEVVFTALLAAVLFREQIAKRVWLAVALLMAASLLVAWGGEGVSWSLSVLLVLLATFFWGVDNNLTREIRDYSSVFIAEVKGLIAGCFNLLIGIFVLGQVPGLLSALGGAALGAVSYGLSLVLFVHALRLLGSARTGAYFSSAPVLAALLSLAIFKQSPGWSLVAAFILVVVATLIMISERHAHEHAHGEVVHTHSHWPDEEHRHAH